MLRRSVVMPIVGALFTIASGLVLISQTDTHRAAAASAACGGEVVARPGGGYYTCSFDDEFNGTTLDSSKWTIMSNTDYHSGRECYVQSPKTVGVAGGALRLTMNMAAQSFRCVSRSTRFYSGMVTSRYHFVQTYGRFEFRAMMPTAISLQSAIWLYPLKTIGPWPVSGEIDVAELFGQNPQYVLPHIHYVAPSGRQAPGTWCSVANAGTRFHTYAVEWTPRFMRFTYDGQTCFTVSGWRPRGPQTAPGPFDKPFVINLTLGLTKAQQVGWIQRTPFPSSMYVDYVRVWK